ncbi:hypothetical protein [Amycolatopsis alkalitolerans]|uniref:hypothetical protein n=1 Tax=Amycolatopsis alkalitolerans TaxID=2547244 RepID=UPI00135717A1|nr:hypothetical protein [Amycolatopsis alkalitolerans]
MTGPDETPAEDLLEQSRDLEGGAEPEVPAEADPGDVAEQWREVGGPEDEEEREHG